MNLLTRARMSYTIARRILAVVESEDFESLFQNATTVEQERIQHAVETLDHKMLDLYISILRKRVYETYTVRELREIARGLNIKYYTLLSKLDLMTEIENERIRRAAVSSQ